MDLSEHIADSSEARRASLQARMLQLREGLNHLAVISAQSALQNATATSSAHAANNERNGEVELVDGRSCFNNFPPEVIILIGENMHLDVARVAHVFYDVVDASYADSATLRSMALTSKRTFELLSPILYRHVWLRNDATSTSFLLALLKRPDLRHYVKSLQVQHTAREDLAKAEASQDWRECARMLWDAGIICDLAGPQTKGPLHWFFHIVSLCPELEDVNIPSGQCRVSGHDCYHHMGRKLGSWQRLRRLTGCYASTFTNWEPKCLKELVLVDSTTFLIDESLASDTSGLQPCGKYSLSNKLATITHLSMLEGHLSKDFGRYVMESAMPHLVSLTFYAGSLKASFPTTFQLNNFPKSITTLRFDGSWDLARSSPKVLIDVPTSIFPRLKHLGFPDWHSREPAGTYAVQNRQLRLPMLQTLEIMTTLSASTAEAPIPYEKPQALNTDISVSWASAQGMRAGNGKLPFKFLCTPPSLQSTIHWAWLRVQQADMVGLQFLQDLRSVAEKLEAQGAILCTNTPGQRLIPLDRLHDLRTKYRIRAIPHPFMGGGSPMEDD